MCCCLYCGLVCLWVFIVWFGVLVGVYIVVWCTCGCLYCGLVHLWVFILWFVALVGVYIVVIALVGVYIVVWCICYVMRLLYLYCCWGHVVVLRWLMLVPWLVQCVSNSGGLCRVED